VLPRVRVGAVAALMGLEAATLAAASSLHLSRLHDGSGSKPFDPVAAGTAEAVLCVVLAAGAVLLARRGVRARPAAVAATAIAVAGFLVGLQFTIRGGDAADLAYHAAVLPLLLVTLVLLLRPRRPAPSAPA